MLTAAVFISLDKWIKNYLAEFRNVFAFQNYSLVEVIYLLIRFNKIKFFPWNAKNTDKNGANKQNTHAHSEIDNTGKVS